MKRNFSFIITLLLTINAFSQTVAPALPPKPTKSSLPRTIMSAYPPKWAAKANIYEVNLRQYTPSGTIKEFIPHLDRLSKMGVEVLWFMPIQPIGIKNRKGSLGSYYSISDYLMVNPEFGTMAEWIELVDIAHSKGMKVIIDWVANHTSFDHAWTKLHPEYYTKDDKGNIIPPVADWTDVADLNYDNKELRKAMLEALRFWVRATKIDGYRCDVADMMPLDFWQEARRELEKVRPGLFMLAESEKPEFHDKAFDMTYTWSLFHPLNDIAAGKKTAKAIDEYLLAQNTWPKNAHRMYFTQNHDENSWQGTEYEKMGAAAQTFAVLTFGLKGMPLIYSGQEAANKKRLRFFDKDTIQWNNYPLADFYTKLLYLKKNEPALEAGENGGNFIKLDAGKNENVYAFIRLKEKSKVMFVFNLSAKPQKIKFDAPEIAGIATDVFATTPQEIGFKSSYSVTLQPWQYQVFRYKN